MKVCYLINLLFHHYSSKFINLRDKQEVCTIIFFVAIIIIPLREGIPLPRQIPPILFMSMMIIKIHQNDSTLAHKSLDFFSSFLNE